MKITHRIWYAVGLAYILFVNFTFAQVIGSPPSTSLPTSAGGGSLGSGKLNFQPDLYTGRFTYSVPISVPPGRGGSQPKLAINYNSSGGNGWCGVGWNLEMGKIERETRFGAPVATGTNGITTYDDSKSYLANFSGIDGHLVLVSPAGQSPKEYRLNTDKSFTKFLYYNQYTNAYWCAIDKNGTQYYFGESISNRIDNPDFSGGYGSNTFRWALSRIVDANQNTTYFTYTNIIFTNNTYTNYQFCPLEIKYNGNTNSPSIPAYDTITFITTNRSDLSVGFLSGFRMESRALLSQIAVKVNGQKVNRYVLGYKQSSSTLRTLLTSVTQYGTDDSSSLPSVTFDYQTEQFGFGPVQSWGGLNSQGQTNKQWNSINATDTNGLTFVKLIDINGDGLPDRVMSNTNSPISSYVVQANTGTNFTGNYIYSGLNNQGQTNKEWQSITYVTSGTDGGTTVYDLIDINGDGRPDRVMTHVGATNDFAVQYGLGITGSNSFANLQYFGSLKGSFPNIHQETSFAFGTVYLGEQELFDVNADGLSDRILADNTVQLNTGSNFSTSVNFPGISDTIYFWGNGGNGANIQYLNQYYGGKHANSIYQDINGDGLTDKIFCDPNLTNGYGYNYQIAFNNGSKLLGASGGVNPNEMAKLGVTYYPLLSEGFTNQNNFAWNSFDYWVDESGNQSGNTVQMVDLIDINGDGLPDRVLTKAFTPFTNFVVQLNTGYGFGPMIKWTNVLSEAGNTSQAWNAINYTTNGQTVVELTDINGDGLPDRIMRKLNPPYTNFMVQLNLGPFPDLLTTVNNGIGGSVQVTYVPSTKYDNTDLNWTNDPWAEGARSLLPFPVYTVSTTVANDGFGNLATNNYTYKHGMFDSVAREFRGFNCVSVTDPYGAKTITYFHQSGGFDDSANGEFQDRGTFSKKGMPYRIETWGTNGLLYQLVLNKVQEYTLNTNGWYFPYVAQTMVLDYEGLNNYRATAVQYLYDTNSGNLIGESDLGEVGSVITNGQTFTDIGSDSIYKWITYTNIAGYIYRPADIKYTSDSSGLNRLQEGSSFYDGRGNLLLSQSWLDTAGAFITSISNSFDQYGNVKTFTDAAGITTTFTFDSTYQQFPISETTGAFTKTSAYDFRFGIPLTTTDVKGLVSSNSYDVFSRLVASYVSTNSYGPPVLWQTKTTYSLAGIISGTSQNYVRNQVNDAVDTINGFETFTYSDGLGRPIQTRTEAETGQFRVANTIYDSRGNPCFRTLPYFGSGSSYSAPSGTFLGSLSEYDSIGRAFRSTGAVNGLFTSGKLTSTSSTGGDTGSPVGAATTAFVDGSNPWATVVTDANNKTKKSYRNAYGRIIQVTDIVTGGNINTFYGYDLLGNLTNVIDNAGNAIYMAYDSFGQKIFMNDPDMGSWYYWYDNSGRLTQQTDGKTNSILFSYNDQLGRLTSKQIYNTTNGLVGTIIYTYDVSDDPNYTVYPGQLYKITDLQGYQRSSYDVRGRTLKSARYLSVNTMEYITQAAYDDAGRVQQLIYPKNTATIQYSYDTAGHISQVKSLAGTGTNETFYVPGAFSALDQLSGYTCGNGVATTYGYYANSKRLQILTTTKGSTNIQNLTYTYDNVSDITSVSDSNYSGAASASISSVTYDDLYRITSVNSTARGVKTYSFSTIGNILTNQDNGSGLYQYGLKPHAVTNANGVNYGYDACGNMTARGNQILSYDAQNQLTQVASTNGTVMFGYDDSGERLFRAGTNGYTIWLGGIYEINNGKVLCHVYAGGQLVATFEPQCTAGLSKVLGEQNWYVASTTISSILSWPFQNGRGRWTLFWGTWFFVLAICSVGGRKIKLKRHQWRQGLGRKMLLHQTVTVLFISAILLGSIGNADAATTFNPVFYYYHPDHLCSSNILTDRYGNLVQHYEYTTFGQNSYQHNTSAFPVSNRYTGQIADDETGLLYYGGRYYDPQLGRFVQADPTVPSPTDSQSLNRYSYCRNNPLNEIDPTGFYDIGGGFNYTDPYGFPIAGFDNSSSSWGYNLSSGYYWSSWSANYGGVTFGGGSGGYFFGSSYSFTGISYGGNTYGEGAIYNSYTPSNWSDGISFGGFYNSPIQYTFGNIAPPPQQAISQTTTGGNWLLTASTVLGAASMLPVIGDFAGIAQAGLELIQGHYSEAAWAGATAVAATFGLGIIVKSIKSASKLVRYGSEAEALASKEAQKLLSRPGHINQPKWIGLEGTIDPRTLGKPQNYTHKIEINLKSDAKDWLNQNAIIKPNEPGRWGIPADKLDEFNNMIKSVNAQKR